MPKTPKKSSAQGYPSELSFQPLKNCLVNLPKELTALLADTLVQDVVVELIYRQSAISSPALKQNAKSVVRSAFVGWTGMNSQVKAASVISGDGSGIKKTSSSRKEPNTPLVEIDSTFAKTVGLLDSQEVSVLIHRDPALIHTVNIEPLTSTDWEIIELHSNFLEIHFISQIRALPNPSYKPSTGVDAHPLTLHLSPTSSASVVVTSLEPRPSATIPFGKLSPNAEVIIAPKSRPKASANGGRDNKSVPSIDGKSSTSTVKTRIRRPDAPSRRPIFLRSVAREVACAYFDPTNRGDEDKGLKVWMDWSILSEKDMLSIKHVLVSIVHPIGFRAPEPLKQSQQDPSITFATSIIAELCPWEAAPNNRHAALSSQLSAILDLPYEVGETVRIEAAPASVARAALRVLRIYPFSEASGKNESLQFGGKTRSDRGEAARKIWALYSEGENGNALLSGALTDGMLLPAITAKERETWSGGILKFDPVPGPHIDKAKSTRGWFLGSGNNISIRTASEQTGQQTHSGLAMELATDIPPPEPASLAWTIGEPLPALIPALVGIDSLIASLVAHVKHGSSLLLTGGHGSGRTSLCYVLAHHFRTELYNTIYFPCRSLVNDETRVSTIKGQLDRVFGLASWTARNGGRSLVILDDIDKLCPVETELEVGNDNGRSRHISELIVSVAKHYCFLDSGIVLLATARGKEEVNNVIIGGHVVREIIALSSPDKSTRRTILEYASSKSTAAREDELAREENGIDQADRDFSGVEPKASAPKRMQSPDGFHVDPAIDFLDIAGQTDGYMPGDLQLLVSRARSEALIRNVSNPSQLTSRITITAADFAAALKGFTPSSLLNVTLQRSSTTFGSVGGLRETRQILIETLQYPTLYAPIFARCPLRLRSGLLLYGYPGCGKTLLASAVAGECGLNFISVKGPEILNKYIGASEKAVRDLFERAQAARPCVLFFDEFDSVAPKRGHDSTGVTDRVVNQLLTQMDGAEGLSGVYVLAATSRPDLIDPALLRPGRLDKSLLCDMPDLEDRIDILQTLSKKLKMDPTLLNTKSQSRSSIEIARRTKGYSGADLQALVYNAHLEAIHDVLGDRSSVNVPSKITGSTTQGNKNRDPLPDFIYFRLGKDAEEEDAPLSIAGKASERSKIAAQLAVYRTAQRAKHAERWDGDRMLSAMSLDDRKGEQESQEPIIEWQHIERALAQTRQSISDRERIRFARIYEEFVVGRSGEMPSGQGSTEVGGRTSLM